MTAPVEAITMVEVRMDDDILGKENKDFATRQANYDFLRLLQRDLQCQYSAVL